MLVVGVLGLGQVGSTFSKGLRDNGWRIKGYDKLWNEEPFSERIEKTCQASGIELVHSPETLAEGANLLISVTTPKLAVETAESVASFLKEGQIYIDFNSAPPKVKEQVARIVSPADFIDGAILGALAQMGYKVPIALSGAAGEKVASLLRDGGMDVECIGSEPGQASALKMIRSVFTKGMECIVLESLHAAKVYAIDEVIKGSIKDFLQNQTLESTMEMLVTTNALHAHRRAGEMEGVANFLEEQGINHIMSTAAIQKLNWSNSLGLRESFNNQMPQDMDEVLKTILRTDKIPNQALK